MRQMVADVIATMHVPRIVYGTVSAISTTSPTVSITLQGTATVIAGVRYTVGFAPAVGDTVICARVGTDLFVLSKIATVTAAWINVGSGGSAASFQNSWGNFGSGYQPARYCRIGSRVYIEGAISGGTIATTMFTLPVGFRPVNSHVFFNRTSSSIQGTSITVKPDGTVTADAPTGGGGSGFLGISGITYDLN
jgi:hypothetical protein